MTLQDAVKKETGIIALGTGLGVLIMFLIFFCLHMAIPEDAPFNLAVPFDIKVILGGIGGFLVAVGNFFWMAVTVQTHKRKIR